MNIFQKAASLAGIYVEEKSVIITSAASENLFGTASRQDGDNFTTNMVSLARYRDSTASNALGLSATWACVNLLAGTIGTLPLMVYRMTNGVREIARDHPLYSVLHDSPNFDQTAVDFWEFISASIELHGNAYADIRKRQNGEISSLIPVRPDAVKVRRNSAGQLEYEWREGSTLVKRSNKDVLHIRGFGGSPLGGASTLAACRTTFDHALDVNHAAGNLFENGALPSGVLSTDRTLTGPQRAEAEKLLNEKFVGALNAGRPMLLDNGVKWEQLTITPEDAQMLESRRFGIEEIARIFGVPPHMIGHTESSTSWGTGLEQQTLGFQKFTLRRRLKRIEQALEKQLLSPADKAAGVTIEFNLDGLLRGDSASRSAFYKAGLNDGWLQINEVREKENLPPVDGGGVNRVQMQNVPLAEADQQENGNG